MVRQQVGVLAYPAQPGAFREGALGERPIIDVGHLAGVRAVAAQVVGQLVQPIPQRPVVITAQGVARDQPHRSA